MSDLAVDLLNMGTLMFAFVSLVFIVLLYRLTRVQAFLVLLGAYAWTAFIRAGISFSLPFVSTYSAPLTIVTLGLHAFALVILYRALKKPYTGNGNQTVRSAISVAAELAKAAALAQVAREHAMQAADAAEAARLFAKHAAQVADEATAASRKATKASGVASEVSREADAKVGEGK